jgi:hypothetical protein
VTGRRDVHDLGAGWNRVTDARLVLVAGRSPPDDNDVRGDPWQDGRRAVRELRPDAGLERVRPRRRHEPAGRGFDDRGPRGPLLVGVPGRRVPRPAVPQVGRHRAHDLGRLLEGPKELVDILAGRLGDVGEPAIDEHEPGAAFAEARRGGRRHFGTEAVTDEHDRAVLEGARSLRDRDNVSAQLVQLVGPGRRRRVRQAVAPEVHRDRPPPGRAEPPRDRGPRPGARGETVDWPAAGSRGPVEEVDPVPAVRDDHVADRLGDGVHVG